MPLVMVVTETNDGNNQNLFEVLDSLLTGQIDVENPDKNYRFSNI